jgi:hypothetical protein
VWLEDEMQDVQVVFVGPLIFIYFMRREDNEKSVEALKNKEYVQTSETFHGQDKEG